MSHLWISHGVEFRRRQIATRSATWNDYRTDLWEISKSLDMNALPCIDESCHRLLFWNQKNACHVINVYRCAESCLRTAFDIMLYVCVCACICACVGVYFCECVHMCVCECICVCIQMCRVVSEMPSQSCCMCVSVHGYVCVCVYVCLRVYVCVCVCVYMCVRVCICVCIQMSRVCLRIAFKIKCTNELYRTYKWLRSHLNDTQMKL